MLLEPTVESLVGVQYGRRGSHALDELPDQQARLSGVYVDGTFGRGGHTRLFLKCTPVVKFMRLTGILKRSSGDKKPLPIN